ncbi:unnamed protein product [Phaedon cochleariae]|uniref:Uncharacterized protein n=1 Tax=Phaedon cochleariae TaxID=80249 RepID=A0A9P0DTZ7_PHACE|nr:unnamed protein product [Phaedon cochleariae]
MDRQIDELLNKPSEEPYFLFDYHKFGRGLAHVNKNADHISKTISSTCWMIKKDILEKQESNNGILFSAETYIIQWNFEYRLIGSEKVNIGTIFYHWKGWHANKGFSPVPPNFDEATSIVERICQWSEPPTFFHIFPRNLVVLDGKSIDFDTKIPHLFMVRGELREEIHIYEVVFAKSSLRSKAVFLLVVPTEKAIFSWWGACVSAELKSLLPSLKLDQILRTVDDTWSHFGTKQLSEGQEDFLFINDDSSYSHIHEVPNFTPRLLYCNTITGEFLLTEVEYPLRSANHIASFPFLQSHLYSADQPALFLLVNQSDIWIWKGSENGDEEFSKLVELAEETAFEYLKRTKISPRKLMSVKFSEAGSEPLEFTNIFPYWIRNK